MNKITIYCNDKIEEVNEESDQDMNIDDSDDAVESEDYEDEEFDNRENKRKIVLWEIYHEFERDDDQEIQSIIANKWKYLKTNYLKTNGYKDYYNCTTSKCPSKMYLHYSGLSERVIMYRNDQEHDHSMKNHSFKRLPPEIKEKLDEFFIIGATKPLNVIYTLRRLGFKNLPKPKSITNYFSRLNKKSKIKAGINYSEFKAWCMTNSDIPDEPNKPFVIKHDIVDEKNLKYIRVSVSTKYLLDWTKTKDFLCTGATYKIVFQGHPVVLIGHVDKQRRFHPSTVSLCTSETNEDYCFFFDALKIEFKPTHVLAEAAKAITKAIEISFSNSTRLTCWAHVERALAAKLSHVELCYEKLREIEKDYYNLQLSYSSFNFKLNSMLFFKKWSSLANESESLKDFLQYFKTEWIESKENNWYEGAHSYGQPSTNNALEATKGSIKNIHAQKERFDILKFMKKLLTMVQEWSLDRFDSIEQVRAYAIEPVIDAALWKTTSKFLETKSEVKMISSNSNTYLICKEDEYYEYAIAQKLEIIQCESIGCECVLNSALTFDDYISINKMVHVVTFNSYNWKLSSCTCKTNLKEYICKHILKIAIIKKLTSLDYFYENIGKKARSGRKKKEKPWDVRVD